MYRRAGSPYDEFADHFKHRLGGVIQDINEALEQSRLRDDIRYAARCNAYESIDREFPLSVLRTPPVEFFMRSPVPGDSDNERRAAKLRAGVVPRRKAPQCNCPGERGGEGQHPVERCCSPGDKHLGEIGRKALVGTSVVSRRRGTLSLSPSRRHGGTSRKLSPRRIPSPFPTILDTDGPTVRGSPGGRGRSRVTISVPDVSLSPACGPTDAEDLNALTKGCCIPAPLIELSSSCESHSLTSDSSTDAPTVFVSQALITAQRHGLIASVIQPEDQPSKPRKFYLVKSKWDIIPLGAERKDALGVSKFEGVSSISPLETWPSGTSSHLQRSVQQMLLGERARLSVSTTPLSSGFHQISLSHMVLLYPYGVVGHKMSLDAEGVICGSAARNLLISYSCTAFVEGMSCPYRVFLVICRNAVSMKGVSVDSVCMGTLKAGRLLVLEFGNRLDWLIFILVSVHLQRRGKSGGASLSYGRLLWMLTAHLWYRRGLHDLSHRRGGRLEKGPGPLTTVMASQTPRTFYPGHSRVDSPPGEPASNNLGWRCRGAFAAPTRFVVPPAEPLSNSNRSDDCGSLSSVRGRRFGVSARSQSARSDRPHTRHLI